MAAPVGKPRRAAALICPDGGNWRVLGCAGQRTYENAWPGVKAGRCDESALQVLAAFRPYAPSGLLRRIGSRRRVLGLRYYCPCFRESLSKSSIVLGHLVLFFNYYHSQSRKWATEKL
jgi:hypothetical protein